jgi:hypothetical protein
MVPPIEYPKKVKQTDKKQTLSGSVTPTLQISNLFQLVLQMATKLQLKAGLAFTLKTTGKKDKCKLPLSFDRPETLQKIPKNSSLAVKCPSN